MKALLLLTLAIPPLAAVPLLAAGPGRGASEPETETVHSASLVFTASNRFNGREMDISLMKSDSVSGIFHNGVSYSLWTAKYNSYGSRLWDRVHDSGFNDYPRNLYIAPLGDVVLTYEAAQPQGGGQFFSTRTIMYNAIGQKR